MSTESQSKSESKSENEAKIEQPPINLQTVQSLSAPKQEPSKPSLVEKFENVARKSDFIVLVLCLCIAFGYVF